MGMFCMLCLKLVLHGIRELAPVLIPTSTSSEEHYLVASIIWAVILDSWEIPISIRSKDFGLKESKKTEGS